ncbi:hypothetical protein EAO70_12990 [Streptomyces sp. adm13(2018)]|uniref:hypothetical protein n=1 Tax=Streptomyces sp. adm13(2018) TaxID=2479007 RepID=UPI0011CED03F|nr:hypothetical protein [Streptomyces sp. adm13(2018)]TXS16348.1 hypothetical protein EAO70_12990 [Streptomyces sp. adm13(2018)]
MIYTTDNRGYPYPDYNELGDFPDAIENFATAVDTDLTNSLDAPIDAAIEAKSCRASRELTTQTIATGVNVTLAYDTESYDNDNMINLAGSTTNIVVQSPGVYLLSCSVNLAATGVAGGAAAIVAASTGGVIPNPIGTSKNLDNDKATSLSCMTLHRVATVPETLTAFVRHNHAGSLTASGAQFTATRIS